jgi:hypothetical protein
MKTAINIAIENGWMVFNVRCVTNGRWWVEDDTLFTAYDDVEGGAGYYKKKSYSLETVIFNHDFAKALCGQVNELIPEGDHFLHAPRWKHFLTSIALSPDRQKYLDDYVKTLDNQPSVE